MAAPRSSVKLLAFLRIQQCQCPYLLLAQKSSGCWGLWPGPASFLCLCLCLCDESLYLYVCESMLILLQLFHIAIMMCTLRQADAVFIDFKTRRAEVLLHPQPTLCSACGPIVSVILAELICISFFYYYTKQRLDKIK